MNSLSLFSVKHSSKNIANQRLKLILVHDRTDISLKLLEIIKNEILNVITKYVAIDNSDIEIKLIKGNEKENNLRMLVANIPIKKCR
ncbi:cell division topological specificity factor MinE [Clostridium thailandense]|uniref:cell division topological specificity factor MinE n=1 Tax=Clostridium thailandense TaxID=2794346 RepID=UPI003988BA62